MTSVIFDVRGIPKGQPRPRAFARKVGDKTVARVHDAGTAEAWKSCVVAAGLEKRPASPITGPVRVRLDFNLPRPKRLMRKKDPECYVPHTSTPDADNLAKAVLDALTDDGWWRDDAQVWELVITKGYHPKAGVSGATIRITWEEGET